MDYDLDVMYVAQYAFNKFQGGSSRNTHAFATDVFNRFNMHIQQALDRTGHLYTPAQRSVIAATATMTGGADDADIAGRAVAAFVMAQGV